MSAENSVFQVYLKTYGLHPHTVAQHCGVRYMAVWNILKNKPVMPEHAAAVRAGLQKLTGVDYDGPIATEESAPR